MLGVFILFTSIVCGLSLPPIPHYSHQNAASAYFWNHPINGQLNYQEHLQNYHENLQKFQEQWEKFWTTLQNQHEAAGTSGTLTNQHPGFWNQASSSGPQASTFATATSGVNAATNAYNHQPSSAAASEAYANAASGAYANAASNSGYNSFQALNQQMGVNVHAAATAHASASTGIQGNAGNFALSNANSHPSGIALLIDGTSENSNSYGAANSPIEAQNHADSTNISNQQLSSLSTSGSNANSGTNILQGINIQDGTNTGPNNYNGPISGGTSTVNMGERKPIFIQGAVSNVGNAGSIHIP